MTEEDQKAIDYLKTLILMIQAGYITRRNNIYQTTEAGRAYIKDLKESINTKKKPEYKSLKENPKDFYNIPSLKIPTDMTKN